MVDKIVCPFCKGQRVWAKGQVPSIHGPKQRYVCFACGRTFYKPKVEAKVAKPRAKRAKSGKKKS